MAAAKLSLAEVVSESFTFLFGNLRLFFHLVTIPWIASLVLRIGGAAIGVDSLAGMLVEKAIDFVPTIMFMVGWMRVVLLGPARLERLPGTGWTARESGFFLHLLKVAGITFVLIVLFFLTVGSIDPATLGQRPIDPELAQREATAAPLAIGFLVSALLALRVSFGLAATAVDVPFSPRLSWGYSRGNAWTIVASLFLIMFASGIATMMSILIPLSLFRGMGAPTGAAIVAWTIAILVSYGGAALLATAQAVIFRKLTGWRDGTVLAPPER
ncbi:MAG: hypothetical protein KIT25_19205 [Enhydrobacter sp.]|nr:MAG: hypothetical protein KIT25_19205 [Enhydrobacter sp.]